MSDTEQSDASTSGETDGDEMELMEQQDYERRRELYLSKIIFCERKFNEIKPMLAKLKLDRVYFFFPII